jgi:tetratricopeptide (TPR) repeat protein
MLMDELRLAVTWARPSLLVAMQRSPTALTRAMQAMEARLHELPLRVVHITPTHEQADLLQDMLRTPDPLGCVFFLHNLGTHTTLYDGLNLHREWIVEQRLKLILWLTLDELTLLSHRAPDFWAFRHRVVEFPTVRQPATSRVLPSGVLAWGADESSVMSVQHLRETIVKQETALQTLPPANENLGMRAGLVLTLARLYWHLGAHPQVHELVQAELDVLADTPLAGIRAWLHNALALNAYDQHAYKSALTHSEQALTADAQQSLFWSNHGVICRAAGQGRRSVPSLKKAIRLEPASPLGWEALGYVHYAAGNFTSAIQAFEKAQSLDPNREQSLLMLALCQRELGNMATVQALLARLDDTNAYLTLCREGMLAENATASDKLTHWLARQQLPSRFAQRDPILHFIFRARL